MEFERVLKESVAKSRALHMRINGITPIFKPRLILRLTMFLKLEVIPLIVIRSKNVLGNTESDSSECGDYSEEAQINAYLPGYITHGSSRYLKATVANSMAFGSHLLI